MKFNGLAKAFNVKEFGNGHCRFGININTKKQDGTYTQGKFVNAVAFNQVLQSGQVYNFDGFIEDNEYNGNTELVFKVKTAEPYGQTQAKPQAKPMPKQTVPEINLDEEIPF